MSWLISLKLKKGKRKSTRWRWIRFVSNI